MKIIQGNKNVTIDFEGDILKWSGDYGVKFLKGDDYVFNDPHIEFNNAILIQKRVFPTGRIKHILKKIIMLICCIYLIVIIMEV